MFKHLGSAFLIILLLTACTVEVDTNGISGTNNNIDSTVADSDSALDESSNLNLNLDSELELNIEDNQVEYDFNEVDELQLLLVALDKLQSVNTLRFSSSDVEEYYIHNDDVEYVNYDIYAVNYDGTIQRENGLAHINSSMAFTNGALFGDRMVVDDQRSEDTTYYFDNRIGKFSGSDGVEGEDSYWSYQSLDDDDDYKTVEHLEELIAFFVSYPDQITMVDTNDYESSEPLKEVQLHLTQEQYYENIDYLENLYFSGMFSHRADTSPETYFIIEEYLRDMTIRLRLNANFHVVELFIAHTTNLLHDYEGPIKDDFRIYSLSASFDSYNEPFNFEIPSHVLNAME